MPDYNAIATALAARYAPAQVTPPAGYTNIRVSTADAPNALPPLPSVIVFAESGDFETGNGTRLGTAEFRCNFYYNQVGDLSRDMAALRAWLTVLVDQLRTSVQLGGAVVSAKLMKWSIGQLTYAGVEYSGIELSIEIVTSEGWAAVA